MKLKKIMVLLLFVSLVFSQGTVFAAMDIVDLKTGDTITINVSNTPIQKAVDDTEVIGKAPLGTELKLLDKNGLFYKVEYNNTMGWILKTYTKEGVVDNVGNYTSYKQIGQTWSSIPYSKGTISSSGCGPTSAAICISGLGDPTNPGELVKKYTSVHGNLIASTYANRCLLNNIGYNLSADIKAQGALRSLTEGYPIICHAGKGDYTSYGHFMALIGVRGNEVYLSDPYSYSSARNGWIDINTLMSKGVDAFYRVSRKF